MSKLRKQCNGVTAKMRRCARTANDSGFCPQHQPIPVALSDIISYVVLWLQPRDIVSLLSTSRSMRACEAAWNMLHKYMFAWDLGAVAPTIQEYKHACDAAPPRLQPIINKILFQRSEQYVRDCLTMLPSVPHNGTTLHACIIEDWVADKPKLALIERLVCVCAHASVDI